MSSGDGSGEAPFMIDAPAAKRLGFVDLAARTGRPVIDALLTEERCAIFAARAARDLARSSTNRLDRLFAIRAARRWVRRARIKREVRNYRLASELIGKTWGPR